MPATRVIIDMQPAFAASNNPNCLIGVTREIMEAMQEGAPIIFVEYKGSGPTHEGLLKLIRGYRKSAKISKNADGGSSEVVKALARRKFSMKHLRICGVNIDCCVYHTVDGLTSHEAMKDSKIEIVRNACGTITLNYDWRRFVQHPNIQLD